ncbi:hypothetical protein J6590_059567 [Homalodisca vitripennis]|nr:hypothetical protein J6590_059567 [Homalodisca vitripennis]
MRRRSDRSKTKPTPKEESPEKSTRKSHRHSRRRRKSSSSSDGENKASKPDVESITQPIEVQIQDIELPQEKPVEAPVKEKEETTKKSNDKPQEWKEDDSFWGSENAKPAQDKPGENASTNEKEESSVWKVQSSNGAEGGEIQKLKICRQRPTESPEIGETSLLKRLNRVPRESRSTDDSAHEESEKETKKSKHRTRTSSKNSPLVSPTVICDMSEDSPTKIKIINVSHISTEKGGGSVTKVTSDEVVNERSQELIANQAQDDSQISDTLDIALPADDPPPQVTPEAENKQNTEEKVEEPATNVSVPIDTSETTNVKESPKDESKPVEISGGSESAKMSPKTSPTSSPRPKKEGEHSSRSSSGDSDCSEGNSKPRKVKKKRRRELQSTVQRKLSTSASPAHESSDSEDDQKKKEAKSQESTDPQNNKNIVSDKENEADNSLHPKENNVDANCAQKEEKPQCPMPRKRRWGSSKTNHSDKLQVLTISTDSLKSLIPDAKPVPADELQLSVEEEEGQLDDDEEEDEVVALVVKEEEKQIERERQREERQKEKERELAERKKKFERVEKVKEEKHSTSQSNTSDKGVAPRKILLLSDDAKKLARSPSPPRHKPTSVLYITHLVRPFTVQQLKNLLLRTGTIAENGFWIDKIKSKCYVEFTTEDAAVETRHALHGVRWPPSNPKTLVVEFASHDDLIMAQALAEEPDVPRKSEPLTMVEGWVADQARIKERNRRNTVREWDVGKPDHPDEALDIEELKMKEKREQERKTRKERHHRSPTPEAEPPVRKARRKEEDAPAKLLDDLFRKTKTSPCIYWLPLTQEQIAVKEEIRRQHMAEHERRMAELKKAEQARRDRERRNRK